MLPANVLDSIQYLTRLADMRKEGLPLSDDELAGEVQNIRVIVAYAVKANSLDRRDLIATFSGSLDLLGSWAEGGAILAVRKNDPGWIEIGLVALVLDDLRTDWRETLINLSLLGNSARKIGAELDRMAKNAAEIANEKCGQLIRSFFDRRLEEQSIELMGYREDVNEHGFTYTPLELHEIP